jgi:hypothetical protein
MGTRELAAALGINPGHISRLTKRGMPMSSTEAANSWRSIHAPPRNRRKVVQQATELRPEDFKIEALEFSKEELADLAFDDSTTA